MYINLYNLIDFQTYYTQSWWDHTTMLMKLEWAKAWVFNLINNVYHMYASEQS